MGNNKAKEKDFFMRWLDRVEKVGNSLPHPATIFFILTLVVAIASMIAAKSGVQVTYEIYDTTQKKMVE